MRILMQKRGADALYMPYRRADLTGWRSWVFNLSTLIGRGERYGGLICRLSLRKDKKEV
jgi:hypothetical protein